MKKTKISVSKEKLNKKEGFGRSGFFGVSFQMGFGFFGWMGSLGSFVGSVESEGGILFGP